MKQNNWVAYVAVIALVLAVVAVSVMLKNGITGNAIWSTNQDSQMCKTFDANPNQPINTCGGTYTKCINGFILGGMPGDIITVPLSCDNQNPRQMLDGAWNDVYDESNPIIKVDAAVTCCKR